jgi:hypothetical protein
MIFAAILPKPLADAKIRVKLVENSTTLSR